MSRIHTWTLGGGLVFLLQSFWFRHFQIDDAFITYRYARNWADAHGPVMNVGERVEGVSNLPWTAFLAFVDRLGLEPHVAAPVLGTLCGLVCVVLVTHLGALWSKRRAQGLSFGAGVLLAASAPMAIWGISGLETLLYTTLVTTFLILSTQEQWLQRRVLLGVVLGVVASMRPEAVLLALAWIASSIVHGSWRTSLPRTALGFLLVVVPLLALRFWYYGEWVANPVVAKSSLSPTVWFPGLVYAAKAVVSTLPLWALAWIGWRNQRRRPFAWLAAFFVGAQLLFMVAVGGERFPGLRFLVPILPVLAALAIQALHGDPEERQTMKNPAWRRFAWLSGAVVGSLLVWKPDAFLFVVEAIARNLRLQQDVGVHTELLIGETRFAGMALLAWTIVDRLQPRRSRLAFVGVAIWLLLAGRIDASLDACRLPGSAAYHGRRVGEWLRQQAPPGTLVATNAAGALPYFSRLPVIDMLGLTDGHIARSTPDPRQWIGHERGDGHYVLQRRPDIVILGGAEGSARPWSFPGDRQIAISRRFQEQYEVQRVQLNGFEFTYYRSRSGRMPRLAESNSGPESRP